jgi:hypothetical protein
MADPVINNDVVASVTDANQPTWREVTITEIRAHLKKPQGGKRFGSLSPSVANGRVMVVLCFGPNKNERVIMTSNRKPFIDALRGVPGSTKTTAILYDDGRLMVYANVLPHG